MVQLPDGVDLDIQSTTGLSNEEAAKLIAGRFQDYMPEQHYVYCFSFEQNETECWYVGETGNLRDRIATHTRQKDIDQIERIEVVESRDEALEREREMSYEVAIDNDSTRIYGGR
jgi:predicted GIY-YIG superfamily endonuclease